MNNIQNPINTFQQSYMNGFNPQNNQFFNQNQSANNIITTFAKGMEGAKQYPLEANKIAVIFDSTPNTNVFYFKDTTGNGKPFRIFDYTEREEPDEAQELSNLKQEIANLKAEIAGLAKPLQELMGTNDGKVISDE